MPKVFSWRGYRFHFLSNEGDPPENCHIHVQKGNNRAKFWIEPYISLAYNYGYSSKDLNAFHKIIEENEELIRSKWYEYFPRLLKASSSQRENYILSGNGTGIHWEEIDEDISVYGLLMGKRDLTQKKVFV